MHRSLHDRGRPRRSSSGEGRLILDYFEAGQRDLADVVRDGLGFTDEAFGVGRVGRVRITVERLGPWATW